MKWLIAALLIWAAWKFLKPKRRVVPAPPHPDRARIDAFATLGIAPDSDADAIRAAHRRLLTGVHPDRGGSDDLARRVNAARDLLLGGSGGGRA